MNRFTGLILLMLPCVVLATDPYPKNDAINVVHYAFQLEVNDTTDVIAGLASVDILFLKDISSFELDLGSRDGKADGMEVSSVECNGKALKFTHGHDRLKIMLEAGLKKNKQLSFSIRYHGIARDGFVIAKNKFGDRGFFGDNYPDRGHHWLPVIDHPSDKASVDFTVIAPLYYSVVANGIKTEESMLDSRRKLTRYHEPADLPVKTMVVGIARFAVQRAGVVDNIAVESWVFPQNREAGFSDYAIAVKILDFFHTHIGPYSYPKLANVQSKTRWGGLENAGAIFYYENSVTGTGKQESLIAHEEAHQWFGNSVSENDWQHVWLSEGFATYFSHLYMEYAYGHDHMVQDEIADREAVIKFNAKNARPVVDTANMDLNNILNTNSYQKGGWVLHMLRHKIGEVAFWNGIRRYYETHRNGNALTGDLQRVMEEASGMNLASFFKQWIWRAGHPKLNWSWKYDEQARAAIVTIEQSQATGLFDFPLEVGVRTGRSTWEVHPYAVTSKTTTLSIPVAQKPEELLLDPNTWLLFEGQMKP